jgi:polyphosphate kinase
MLDDSLPLPELRDRAIYFFVKLTKNKKPIRAYRISG